MKIECTHPVRAHVLADFFQRHDMPAMVIDEMDTVLGYGVVPTSVFLPDEFREEAEALMKSEKPELPEDPEFVYQDGIEPRKVGPLEFAWGGPQLLRATLFVLLAALAVAGIALLGDILGWKIFVG